jgi:hypothetical protein
MLCELGSCYRWCTRFPFRAIPNNPGETLEGDQPFAQVGPLRHLFNADVIARLSAGAVFEQSTRHIYHMRRARALIANRRAAARAKAAGRARGSVFKLRDIGLPLDNAEAATPTADVGGISSAVGMTTCCGMIMPSPPGWKIDLNAHVAAKAFTRHSCRSRLYGASGYCFSQRSTPKERGTTFTARLPLNADRLDQNPGNTRAD